MRFILLFFIFSGCKGLIQGIDSDYYKEYAANGKSAFINLVFSHNINGETHPCGCRHHPLGGIAQVAGALQETRNSAPTIYIDTGDTFFPTSSIPNSVKKSLSFKAKEIGSALSRLELNYYLPGDYDFALGEDFLVDLVKNNNLNIILTNASSRSKLPHKKWAAVKFKNRYLFILGVLHPSLSSTSMLPVKESLDKALIEINKKFPNINKSYILLSHSGLEYDKQIAQQVPVFDWIIGSHSQSFLQTPIEVGKTRIVQVLSRNHYLGHIKLATQSSSDSYSLIEIRDQKKDVIEDNPFLTWLDQHKSQVEKIQLAEQKELSANIEVEKRILGAKTCMECHTAQGKFWQATAHALSYHTLVKAKENFNTGCIECHSVGFKDPNGFIATQYVVDFKEDKNHDQKLKNYLSDLKENLPTGSIRSLSKTQRLAGSKKWFQLDEKHKVQRNLTNVQCLNCHNQDNDHPFSQTPPITDFTQTCIKCHTPDQSPQWYEKDSKGLATTLNKTYFAQQLKKVSCPKDK